MLLRFVLAKLVALFLIPISSIRNVDRVLTYYGIVCGGMYRFHRLCGSVVTADGDRIPLTPVARALRWQCRRPLLTWDVH
jgi:hypothetical protein